MPLWTGHALADRINAETAALLEPLPRAPRLALLRGAGAGPAAYAARIAAYAERLGIAVVSREDWNDLPEEADAILPLHPLPPGADPATLIDAIGAERDADGQHPLNMGLLALGRQDGIAPATAQAARRVAEELCGPLKGRRICIVGASSVVGRPLALLLLQAEATVSVGHAATRDLSALTRAAELVISATGVPGLIRAAHVATGATVIDVGLVRTAEGLRGDADPSLAGIATLTHVPDGVGPVTTACLLRNVARLATARDRARGL